MGGVIFESNDVSLYTKTILSEDGQPAYDITRHI